MYDSAQIAQITRRLRLEDLDLDNFASFVRKATGFFGEDGSKIEEYIKPGNSRPDETDSDWISPEEPHIFRRISTQKKGRRDRLSVHYRGDTNHFASNAPETNPEIRFAFGEDPRCLYVQTQAVSAEDSPYEQLLVRVGE